MYKYEFYRKNVEDQKRRERDSKVWGIVNSSLIRGTNSYQSRFEKVVPPSNLNIKEYIESELSDKKGCAVGLELGGIGSQLFDSFTPGFFSHTFGVTLVDNRRLFDGLKEPDNHQVIEGDIFTDETIAIVGNKLPSGKADLIIESMVGGVLILPRKMDFLGYYFSEWYKKLAEGGLAFIEFPFEMPKREELFLYEWQKVLQDSYSTVIDIDVEPVTSVMRLKRMQGSPEQLPVLDVVQIRDFLKRNMFRN